MIDQLSVRRSCRPGSDRHFIYDNFILFCVLTDSFTTDMVSDLMFLFMSVKHLLAVRAFVLKRYFEFTLRYGSSLPTPVNCDSEPKISALRP